MQLQRQNNYKSFSLIFLLVVIAFPGIKPLKAQTVIDTVAVEIEAEHVIESDSLYYPEHSARRASLYSMVLPGLGQAYNEKYWKIPIIYGGFTVFYFLIQYNNTEYQLFKDAYYHKVAYGDSDEPVNEYEVKYDVETLLSAKNDYRRNRDLNYILTGVWYALNVIDAAVDAHLFSWNVDPDLSLSVEPDFYTPTMLGQNPGGGVKLTLRF